MAQREVTANGTGLTGFSGLTGFFKMLFSLIFLVDAIVCEFRPVTLREIEGFDPQGSNSWIRQGYPPV